MINEKFYRKTIADVMEILRVAMANNEAPSFNHLILDGLNLSGLCFEGASFEGTSLRRTDFVRANINKCNFYKADLFESTLPIGEIRDVDFSKSNLEGADLSCTDLINCNFEGSNLMRIDLEGCNGDGEYIRNIDNPFTDWNIVYTIDQLSIGCQQHAIEDWENFSDSEIDDMDISALYFWEYSRDSIFKEIRENPAK